MGGDLEAVVEEQADREKLGAPVGADLVEQIGAWGIEDEGGGLRMLGGELGRERGADAGAEEDDLGGWEVAGGRKVLPGRGGVLFHAALIGMGGGALTEAAVVEGEDIEADGM